MHCRFQRGVVTLVLAICIVCPLVEMFDQWDHTIQTGQDTEYAFVVLALCAGALLTFARAMLRLIGHSPSERTAQTDNGPTKFGWTLVNFLVEISISASPPLTSLRI